MKIDIVQGDITELNVDAIVDAANSSLMGGGGVDGAIHRKAGPELLEECKKIRQERYKEGLPTGEAVITKGYNLKAKYVIHTVGPVYSSNKDQSYLLANCFTNSLKIADEYNTKSIAFPAISTGVYRYPVKECAKIAKDAINSYKAKNIEKVILCLFDNDKYTIFKGVFK